MKLKQMKSSLLIAVTLATKIGKNSCFSLKIINPNNQYHPGYTKNVVNHNLPRSLSQRLVPNLQQRNGNHHPHGRWNGNHDSKHLNSASSFSSLSSILHQTFPRGGASMDEETATANDHMNKEEVSNSQSEELDKEDNNLDKPTILPQYSLPNDQEESAQQGLILMDNFCPYHGGYLSHRARTVYGAGIVNTLSEYVLNCLIQDSEDEEETNQFKDARIPTTKENIELWLKSIPFEIMGIICESDSGLDDAERLGVAIGLNPKRHDGYNKARRDKVLMNQVVGEHGLRVVRQKFCPTLEDAIAFAKDELNVPDTDYTSTTNNVAINFVSNEPSLAIDDPFSDNPNPNIDQHVGLLGKGNNVPSTNIRTISEEENHQASSSSSSSSYCVVKPCRGVASDDVHFCKNIEEVKIAFEKIHQTPVFGCSLGSKHESVLIQEFAKGTEYVMDIVSKNGEHKVAALWRYDKRPCNNAPFVYFATEIINAQTPTGKIVCEYATKCLDALDVKWGISHVEVIFDSNSEEREGAVSGSGSGSGGPILVEVNCRQHNTDFVPLTSMSIGYNALDMLLAAYLGDNDNLPVETEHLRLDWDTLPSLSQPRVFATIVHLVCFVEGEVVAIDGTALEEIENLPSVLAMEIYDHFLVGNRIGKTIDIRSDSGWVHLMNDDENQFISDYNRIVELMPSIFIVQ